MATSRAEIRILRMLGTGGRTPEARRILGRGLRIAAGLNGGHPDNEVLAFVCAALAQEGGLVQELMEELASRVALGLSRSRPPPPSRQPVASSPAGRRSDGTG